MVSFGTQFWGFWSMMGLVGLGPQAAHHGRSSRRTKLLTSSPGSRGAEEDGLGSHDSLCRGTQVTWNLPSVSHLLKVPSAQQRRSGHQAFSWAFQKHSWSKLWQICLILFLYHPLCGRDCYKWSCQLPYWDNLNFIFLKSLLSMPAVF